MLPEIMLPILAATLASANAFVENDEYGKPHLPFLRGFLAYAAGIPCHDVLNDFANALAPEGFKSCCPFWVATLSDAEPVAAEEAELNAVSFDGKTSRRAHARGRGCNPLHLYSV